jgi:hypothetical protein
MKFSKYKVDKMFRLGYKLAFETNTKKKTPFKERNIFGFYASK